MPLVLIIEFCRYNEIGSDGVSMNADLTQVDTVTVTTTDATRLILSSSTEPVQSEDTFSKETTVASTALSRANRSVIVLENTFVVISGLRPFEEIFIEVVYSVMHQSSNG